MIDFIVKYKSHINKIISLFAFVFSAIWVYYKREIFSSISADLLLEWSLIIIFSAGLNILFEALKWRATFKSPPAFFLLLKYVTIGIFYGLISPNRIGEYGRKIPGISWRETISTTFITRTLQSIPTFTFGILSAFFFLPELNIISKISYQAVIILLTIAIIFSLWLYYFIRTKRFYRPIIRELKLFSRKLSEIRTFQAIIFRFCVIYLL